MTLASNASSVAPQGRFAEARAVEQTHNALQNARAARTVACYASDAQDCEQLLSMLGLDAMDGKRADI
jgi:hypothetical protein